MASETESVALMGEPNKTANDGSVTIAPGIHSRTASAGPCTWIDANHFGLLLVQLETKFRSFSFHHLQVTSDNLHCVPNGNIIQVPDVELRLKLGYQGVGCEAIKLAEVREDLPVELPP